MTVARCGSTSRRFLGWSISNGYNQSLAASPSQNPLAGRRAFGGQSAGYPTDWVTTKIEIGKLLAGKNAEAPIP
jgi:hypothetical protein